MRVEHEYGRCGAWAYMAALDVHNARIFGRIETKTGAAPFDRLRQKFPRLILVHGPIHASWLNQIEIYFSIVQRKVLTPNDFSSLNQLAERILDFQYYWEPIAKPSEWKYTKADLAKLLNKLKDKQSA